MKLATILMTYNEDDIILKTLEDRIKIFDKIIILDSSTDETPAICHRFADNNYPKVIYEYDSHPLENKYFRNRLIDLCWKHLELGDWIFQLDADNFIWDDNPNMAITAAERDDANVIMASVAQFYYTFKDYEVKRYWQDLPYYSINWQLKCGYKLLPGLEMGGKNGETPNQIQNKNGRIRLIIKHYQYRSPAQIQKKVDRAHGLGGYSHILSADWRDYVMDEKLLKEYVPFQGLPSGGNITFRDLFNRSKEDPRRKGLYEENN